jgi:hypothetical protein
VPWNEATPLSRTRHLLRDQTRLLGTQCDRDRSVHHPPGIGQSARSSTAHIARPIVRCDTPAGRRTPALTERLIFPSHGGLQQRHQTPVAQRSSGESHLEDPPRKVFISTADLLAASGQLGFWWPLTISLMSSGHANSVCSASAVRSTCCVGSWFTSSFRLRDGP